MSGLTDTTSGGWGTRLPFDALTRPQRRRRSFRRAVLAGIAGDRALPFGGAHPVMSWRLDYRDVSSTELCASMALQDSQPAPVAIFVHGLMTDESCWGRSQSRLGRQLQRHLGWVPLFVRYNSGLHISQNGRLLADRIRALYAAGAGNVSGIQIMGHSMGGLVARAALEDLRREDHPALAHIQHLFLLCTPNGGVDLEHLRYGIASAREKERNNAIVRGKTAAERGPDAIPLPILSDWLAGASSAGIQDARFGYMQPREWQAQQQHFCADGLAHRRPLPPPAGVQTWAIAASLAAGGRGKFSPAASDGIVTVQSACGRNLPFDDLHVMARDRCIVIPRLIHQHAPNSRRVAKAIVRAANAG